MRQLIELIVPGRKPLPNGIWRSSSVAPVEIPEDVSLADPVGAAYDEARDVWRVLVVQYVDRP